MSEDMSIVFAAVRYGSTQEEIKLKGYTDFRLKMSKKTWLELLRVVEHHAFSDGNYYHCLG